MPKRKVREEGPVKVEPKRHSARLSLDAKPKKASGKGESIRQKGAGKVRRGAKGKQAEVADQQTTDLPAENEETENQSPVSEEEKEAKSD